MATTYLQFGTAPGPMLTRAVDDFTAGYLEAIEFTDMSSEGDNECYGMELSEDALAACLDDCEAFQRTAADLLTAAYARDGYTAQRAGHDFWLTRNGHGAGFWDRIELEADGLGDQLTELCGHGTEFPGVDVCAGDDGEAHII